MRDMSIRNRLFGSDMADSGNIREAFRRAGMKRKRSEMTFTPTQDMHDNGSVLQAPHDVPQISVPTAHLSSDSSDMSATRPDDTDIAEPQNDNTNTDDLHRDNDHLTSTQSMQRVVDRLQLLINDNLDRLEPNVLSEAEVRNIYQAVYGSLRSPALSDTAEPNTIWRDRWQLCVSNLFSKRWETPNGQVGREVAKLLADELEASNNTLSIPDERFLVAQMVIFQRSQECRKAVQVKRKMMERISLWRAGKYDDLISDAIKNEKAQRRAYARQNGRTSADHIETIFTKLMLEGRIRDAVRWATNNGTTKVVMPEETILTPSGKVKTALEVLEEKHPVKADVNRDALNDILRYDLTKPESLPAIKEFDVTEEDVEKQVRLMQGSAGPTGVDAHILQRLLTCHGQESKRLREQCAKRVELLSRTDVPWQKIAASRACREIALGTHLEEAENDDLQAMYKIRPIGVGEIWYRLFTKLVVSKTKAEAIDQCGIDQLCTGISGGAEGAIHAVNALFEELQKDNQEDQGRGEPWVLLKLDASNAFNMLNRDVAILLCRVYWPSASRYVLNSYRGDPILIVRSTGGVCTLMSKEGTTQGDPMAMLMYAIGTLPLVRKLKSDHVVLCRPSTRSDDYIELESIDVASIASTQIDMDATHVGAQVAPTANDHNPETVIIHERPRKTQIAFADDINIVAPIFDALRWGIAALTEGPSFGYHVNPDKCKFIVCIPNSAIEETSVYCDIVRNAIVNTPFSGAPVVVGAEILGAYVGDEEGRCNFVAKKVGSWASEVEQLVNAGRSQPHLLFASHTHSQQHKPTYIQRTVIAKSSEFAPLEHTIRTELLPEITPWVALNDQQREVMAMPVRSGGIGITDPTQTAALNHQVATTATSVLVKALLGKQQWNAEDHHHHFRQTTSKHKAAQQEKCDARIEELVGNGPEAAPGPLKRCIKRAKEHKSGMWLLTKPIAAMQTYLPAHEYEDGIGCRYGVIARDIRRPTCDCDGRTQFDLDHALCCKKGGAVVGRHNIIRDTLVFIAETALSQSQFSVQKEPWIGRNGVVIPAAQEGTTEQSAATDPPGLRVDVRMRGLKGPAVVTDIDVRCFYPDAQSYTTKTLPQLFKQHAKEKLDKYKAACNAAASHFVPFIVTTDGALGTEANELLNLIGSRLAKKWRKTKGVVMSWIRARLSIAIVKATSACIRCPRHAKTPRPEAGFEDGAALPALFSH